MGFLDLALRAVREMGEGVDCSHSKAATKATQAHSVPRMPDGVFLLEWSPKPPPVLLTHMAVVNDVAEFIRTALVELDSVLHSALERRARDRRVRDLVDRLEQCDVFVRVRSCDSNNSVTCNETTEQ